MSSPPISRMAVRVHLTNVQGAGATQLVKSLLPALEQARYFYISDLYLPDHGDLAGYRCLLPQTRTVHYRRRAPNGLSRILECTFFGRRFGGEAPLLVLGDLPLRCSGRQVVFVQTLHLTHASRPDAWRGIVKYAAARLVFNLNLRHVQRFIVQTEVMKAALTGTYPHIRD